MYAIANLRTIHNKVRNTHIALYIVFAQRKSYAFDRKFA